MSVESRLKRYAKELALIKVQEAAAGGLCEEEVEALCDLIRDAFLNETPSRLSESPAVKKGPYRDPDSKMGRVRDRILELWNGSADQFYIDDMLDIDLDYMQKAVSRIFATSKEFAGFSARTWRDPNNRILFIKITEARDADIKESPQERQDR